MNAEEINVNKIINYLKRNVKDGREEFRIAFQDHKNFIIHPLNKDGETIDLLLPDKPKTEKCNTELI